MVLERTLVSGNRGENPNRLDDSDQPGDHHESSGNSVLTVSAHHDPEKGQEEPQEQERDYQEQLKLPKSSG
ncbi:hypothetical protein SAMN05444392_11621 [Seinonella peptonophila]|uniref:Uncharacterized protein n=1 Tax=Seinonella peptonophila TaxID=112248 RepID=A0A1M5AW08_9BACL|nr:hypothetical protein [Seinonella peptonophila]SHF34112.1 hypothetical protein SAMN05444392_11621 [Seinonella peptonophila]